MRSDSIGFFWEDLPRENRRTKGAEPAARRQPPERFWLAEGYLPNDFDVDESPPRVSADELLCGDPSDPLVLDVECFPNFFCVVVLELRGGRSWVYEHGKTSPQILRQIVENRRIVTFNGLRYDLPMISIAVTMKPCSHLAASSKRLIAGEAPWMVTRSVDDLECDHVDVSDVAPLFGSLKVYAGRMHCEILRDLPFPPEADLTPEQIRVCVAYCLNDCRYTAMLYDALEEPLRLRRSLSAQYGVDVRSKSDAQIAETVLKTELYRRGIAVSRGSETQSKYFYSVPDCVKFDSPELRELLEDVREAEFPLGADGRVKIAPSLAGRTVSVDGREYSLGLGGMHSNEKSTSWYATGEHRMAHVDVSSYYPFIALTQRLSPPSAPADDFLDIYGQIVKRRLDAKSRGDKTEADSLKITVNGTFGKQGSPHSFFYAPANVMQITLSGQLYLLMLIERLVDAGADVCSANTDGVMLRYPASARRAVANACANWSRDTRMTLDVDLLRSLHARDVNNYVAIDANGEAKTKGVFASPNLWKNPANRIVYEAAIERVRSETPVADTVFACRDVRKFLTLRTVRGGAVWKDAYLGGVVRWYRVKSDGDSILYAESGNHVAGSNSSRPVSKLPSEFPDDADCDWYADEALKTLGSMGVEC